MKTTKEERQRALDDVSDMVHVFTALQWAVVGAQNDEGYEYLSDSHPVALHNCHAALWGFFHAYPDGPIKHCRMVDEFYYDDLMSILFTAARHIQKFLDANHVSGNQDLLSVCEYWWQRLYVGVYSMVDIDMLQKTAEHVELLRNTIVRLKGVLPDNVTTWRCA